MFERIAFTYQGRFQAEGQYFVEQPAHLVHLVEEPDQVEAHYGFVLLDEFLRIEAGAGEVVVNKPEIIGPVGGRGVAGGAVHDAATLGRHGVETFPPDAPADAVEHDVERPPVEGLGQILGKVGAPHDAAVAAFFFQYVQLAGAAYGADGEGAEMFGDTDGPHSYPAGRAVDEHVLAALQVAEGAQGVVGGEHLYEEGGAVFKVPSLRQMVYVPPVDIDPGGIGPEAGGAHYAVAGFVIVYALPHRGYLAAEFEAGRELPLGRGAV